MEQGGVWRHWEEKKELLEGIQELDVRAETRGLVGVCCARKFIGDKNRECCG